MGGVLSGGLSAASLACQSAICCCNVATCMSSAGNGLNGVSSRAAKLYYVLVLGLGTLLALVLRYNGDQLNLNLHVWQVHCSDTHDAAGGVLPGGLGPLLGYQEQYVYCKGDAAVFRISFVLSCFFAFMTVSTFFSGARLHRGWWGPKLVALFFALLACFFITNSFFDNSGFAWLARVVSMAFLVLQILILVDFAYQWNDAWVALAFPAGGEDNQLWLVAILGCSALLYLVVLAGVPLVFTFYGDCPLGVAFATVTLVGVVALTGLTLFRDKIVGEEHEGAILPAAVVSAYAVYLCWSALQSNPDAQCKPDTGASAVSVNVQMALGMAVAVLSVCWTSLSATEGIEALVKGSEASDKAQGSASTPLYTVESAGGGERTVEAEAFEGAGDDDDEGGSLWLFHLVMMTASMYMAMLITNWGAEDGAHGNEDGQVGLASAWVKGVSGWCTMLVYSWTLVAPKVMGAYRDF